jgi:1-acyl-sn-glycerol-3-phosphate acyltransferase
MRVLMAIVRLGAFTIMSLAIYVTLLAGVMILRAAGRSPFGFKGRMTRRWARCAAAIVRMKVSVAGEPPSPPFLLVANHLSYMDVIALMTRIDCVFVAKSEIARWPFIGTLCRAADTIFIERDKLRDIPRTLSRIERALGQGHGVVIFPEGTGTAGDEVLAFRPSLLEPAARARIPVTCATVTYATPPGTPSARDTVCWWGNTPFLPHLWKLLRFPGFEARITFGDERIVESDRKILAERSWRAVQSRFEPVAS